MVKRVVKKFFQTGINRYYYLYTYLHEKNNIKAKRVIWNSIQLTKDQNKQIKAIYKNNISNKWHRLYQSYTGEFDQNYFPEILFSCKLEPVLCPRGICKVLEDKGLLDILYGNVSGLRLPRTIITNCSGVFYDGNRNIISIADAIDLVEQWQWNKGFVIKPTLGTNSGKNVTIIKPGRYVSTEKLKHIFMEYKQNYVVQEHITNSEALSSLYSNSLNTIRVITYILEDKLYNAPLTIRMGRSGNEVDNIHAGGIFVGLSEEGYLKSQAYSEYGDRYTAHPDSQIRFADCFIPNVALILECAYACHMNTPHVKCISWDFTLDEEDNPVLIEANMYGHSVWLPQMANGKSLFADNTGKMLNLIGL